MVRKIGGILAALLFIVIAGMCFWAPRVSAANYYVSTTGNDSNSGTQAQPWLTIQKAQGVLKAGDTLYIRAGTYAEHIAVHVVGTPSDRITISGYPGETAVIDGSSITGQDNAVDVFGGFITVKNLEITNTAGGGLRVWKNYGGSQTGTNAILDNLNIHNTLSIGVSVFGDNALIENNRIWKTNLSNDCDNRNPDPGIGCGYPYWGGALSFGDSTNAYYCQNCIVRNNDVYQNYGEGILCMYTDNALIEGNRVWDNWAEGIYLDQCSYATIRNNLSYYTTDHEYWRFTDLPAAGIMFSNEGIIKGHPIGHDLKIYNNIVANAGYGIYFWNGFVSTSAAINTTISNNTVVNNYAYGYGIAFNNPNGTASHQNTIIENNIVQVLGTPLFPSTTTGLTFSHNLWSKTPVYLGSGDIVGNPLLNDPTHSVDISIDPAWYKLTSSSPAIDSAVSLADVTDDYFGTTRPQGTLPDIGAHEYTSAVSTPTPTPVVKLGDANGDGQVNETDFTIWLSHFGQTVSGVSNGDFNGDSKVDGVDYTIWLNNYGK